MGLRNIFSRKPDPSTAHLQRGDEKNPTSVELVLPPRDEHGRFVNDPHRKGMTLTEATQLHNEKKY